MVGGKGDKGVFVHLDEHLSVASKSGFFSLQYVQQTPTCIFSARGQGVSEQNQQVQVRSRSRSGDLGDIATLVIVV